MGGRTTHLIQHEEDEPVEDVAVWYLHTLLLLGLRVTHVTRNPVCLRTVPIRDIPPLEPTPAYAASVPVTCTLLLRIAHLEQSLASPQRPG